MREVRYLAGVLLVLTILPASAGAQGPDDASRLFHQAVTAETIQGDLERAISLYDQLVRRFPDHRRLAAEAMFRSGRCEELMGEPQNAEILYRRLLHEYPDAGRLVDIARDRLNALTGDEGTAAVRPPFGVIPTFEELAELPWWMLATDVSPDGRLLAYVDARSGDLLLWDAGSGESRPITTEAGLLPSGPGSHAIGGRFDTDGSRLAYTWHDGAGNVDLHIVPVTGDGIATVSWDPEYAAVHPLQLTSDGTLVLSVSEQGDGAWDIVLVEEGTWQSEVLHHMYGGPALSGVLRPGSDQVIFDGAEQAREYYGDVLGTTEEPAERVPVYGSSPHDYMLAWSEPLDGVFVHSNKPPFPAIYFAGTPHGEAVWSFDEILLQRYEPMISFGFVSDRSAHGLIHRGTEPIWLRDAFWGLPAVYISRWAEARAREEFGQAMPFSRPLPVLAQSREGTMLWALRSRTHTMEIVDLETGGGSEQTVQFLSGPDVQMRWSPEGRFLAYLVPDLPTGWPESGPALFLYDALRQDRERWQFSTGSEVDLLSWSSDGSSILIQESAPGAPRILEVEPGRQARSPFAIQSERPLLAAHPNTDGSLLGVVRSSRSGDQEIVALSPQDTSGHVLHRTSSRIIHFRGSVTGRSVAWIEYDPPAQGTQPDWRLRYLRFGNERAETLLQRTGDLPSDLVRDTDGRLGIVLPSVPDDEGGIGGGPAVVWVDPQGTAVHTEYLPIGEATVLRLQGTERAVVLRLRPGFETTWVRLKNLEESVRNLRSSSSGGGP
ncbi:MAG: tetratricopeptide repeat protein [bacterium]